MGQANLRGTKEQRIAQAIAAPFKSKWEQYKIAKVEARALKSAIRRNAVQEYKRTHGKTIPLHA